ncbi:MAG: polysaccharide pyruvyl transferase CsaB [Microcystaceae cyanobacterium]
MRAVLCGYYGKGNAGDEALLVSLLQLLPPWVEPVVLSANPSNTSQQYGVESCPHRSLFSILKAFKQSDAFIWGGGSLMQDVTSLASPIYYGGLMAYAQQQGLKTIAWAQGIGPLKHPFTRWLTKQVLLGCHGISVRDDASAEWVSQWQLSPILAPDPVWSLQGKSVTTLSDLPAPRVAVNLRSHPLLTEKRLDILTKALISFQKATNICLLLVPFQGSQDLAIAQKIASQLTGVHHIVQLSDPREIKGIFQGVEMTIGMRLHSLIMAASEGCRCHGLSYDPKVSYLMETLDIPGWELSQLPDEPNEISTAWLDYYANGEGLNQGQIQSLCDRALMHQSVLFQALQQ